MDNAPITRSFFNSQLQLSLKFAGLNVKNYKSHSLRIGAATTAWAFPKNKFNKWVVGIAKHLRNIFEYLY
jgi:hypothetical protein